MDGTLVVEEKRGVIDKFRNWYEEKIINSNLSAKAEEGFVKIINFTKGYTKIVEKVGTPIVAMIPEVGVISPIIPVITKAERVLLDCGENIVLKGKRALEATFIGKDGRSEKIVVPEINSNELEQNITNAVVGIKDTVDSLNKGGKSK